jgi:diguanylate cyclase (GGDEF)-like protein
MNDLMNPELSNEEPLNKKGASGARASGRKSGVQNSGNQKSGNQNSGNQNSVDSPQNPRKVVFDDFQIQKNAQQQQIDDEKRALKERERRHDEQRPGFLKFAVPRLRSIREDMIGGKKKLSSFLFGQSSIENDPSAMPFDPSQHPHEDAKPYFSEHERLSIRVAQTRTGDRVADRTGAEAKEQRDVRRNQSVNESNRRDQTSEVDPRTIVSDMDYDKKNQYSSEESIEREELLGEELEREELEQSARRLDREETEAREANRMRSQDEMGDDFRSAGSQANANEEDYLEDESEEEIIELEVIEIDDVEIDAEELEELQEQAIEDAALEEEEALEMDRRAEEEYEQEILEAGPVEQVTLEGSHSGIAEEPKIEPSLMVYLDALRAFDSFPRRASEPRDPRTDFVTLLTEQLEILREQVSAMSALFFWVNNRKQQLVLESASLEDRAYMYLSEEKKFPIELDAVSMVVSRKKPELHSSIPPAAEMDLIPYYTEPIGIASFAAMPVLFGDGLVAVITVDSDREENFSAETLRLLTNHSKLISGLIRSYIEKYDLLASARTLESARKLHQLVSPDSGMRALRADQRRGPEWILRALTEAVSEIIDWEWLATASFDESRRIWSISTLQSRQSQGYVLPQTPIDLEQSIVGKCLTSGRSALVDNLSAQSIRYSLEEDRSSSVGHSFLTIPIRTATRNYGSLSIEHSERARFTEADVETLEHLSRSAAAALEITALSEIVEERALTDLLTSVLNKRGFLQRMNEELTRAMEFDEPLTLVLFEIDGAADFLSRFSQEEADTVILAVTRLLKFGARPFDVIARISEHAFAAILIKMTDEEGYLWSEKMRKMIVSEVIAIGKRSFSVTVSTGVSGARRDATVEELIEGAELAVERAKELGGNNVIVY